MSETYVIDALKKYFPKGFEKLTEEEKGFLDVLMVPVENCWNCKNHEENEGLHYCNIMAKLILMPDKKLKQSSDEGLEYLTNTFIDDSKRLCPVDKYNGPCIEPGDIHDWEVKRKKALPVIIKKATNGQYSMKGFAVFMTEMEKREKFNSRFSQKTLDGFL